MALTQKARERTRVWPTTVAVLALLVALLVLPLALAPRAEAYIYWTRTIDHSIGPRQPRRHRTSTRASSTSATTPARSSVAVDARHIYWLSWLPYGTRSGSARTAGCSGRNQPGEGSTARGVDVDFITGFDAHSGTGMSRRRAGRCR